jgi:hypothetical protein
MTDLKRLKVSLTKHSAHKLAPLLKKFRAEQVLGNLDGGIEHIHVDRAQAIGNLSVSSNGAVPIVWEKARKLGGDAVDALVLLGIIFSHHELIAAMAGASDRSPFSGRIERDVQLKGKAYTNFVRVVDQLGYATKVDKAGINFDLRKICHIPGLSPLVRELLELKLLDANWNRSGALETEIVANGFHNVFGIRSAQLRSWLAGGPATRPPGEALLPKDKEFFETESEGLHPKPFVFTPGHTERAVDLISRASSKKTNASQMHNDIQNRLYVHLCEKYGKNKVGTEQDTGSGTSIDVVTNVDGKKIYFEIKTGASVRSSIRQAIPQLLEYAYCGAEHRADRLVIISHLPVTRASERYLKFLRHTFNLPIYYQQFSLTDGVLI